MGIYTCEKCGRDFKQKSHYNKHMQRKIPCIDDKKLDNVIQKIVDLNTKDIKINKDLLFKSLNPIIKWSGGKKDEIKSFIQYIPTDINIYLEPFIGGGAVYFNLCHHNCVINDVHKELIDFYRAIKDGYAVDIYNFMEENKNDEETYYKVRDKYDIQSYLDNAKRFYYLRKTCYRGMMRYNSKGGFNIPFGKYKTINFDELKNKNYEELLKNTEILNESFEYIFNNYNDSNNFMFLDPPYNSEFTNYGYCSFGKEEHIKLAECFKNTKIRCLLIIGKTDFISNLYRDYIVDEYEKKYRFKLHSGRIGIEIDNKHLIIKNY
jgi:DNA adenine methylase